MGLDITAYANLIRTGDLREDGDCDWPRETTLRANEDFPGRFDDLVEGIYRVSDSPGDVHKFRAGSYSGYNVWRDHLAKMALGKRAFRNDWEISEADAGKPFYELINFSDCEGVIGPRASAKLAADFANHRDKAQQYARTITDPLDGEWFISRYDDWQKAFELGAKNGAVDFH